MAKITYEDKVALNPQPSIANINKVTDTDMNEIKSVVNENAVETGSNANGSWIKYENGTMICYIYKGFNLNITKQFEGVYYENSGDILFPQEFISTPIINITARGLAGGGYSFYTIENNKFSGFIWKTQSKSDANLWLMITAIGRWK